MHLLGQAKIVLPAWEPDQGWRVLDPDGHQLDAGPKTSARPASALAAMLGVDPDELACLQEIARRENRR